MSHPSILLIEPNAEIRRMIRNVLVREMYDIDPVESTTEAAKRLSSGGHRLILCALDPSVLEFLKVLRAGGMGSQQRGLPVVGMATIIKEEVAGAEGYTAEAIKSMAQQVGISGLIAKPLTIGSLVSRVAAVLPAKSGRAQRAG